MQYIKLIVKTDCEYCGLATRLLTDNNIPVLLEVVDKCPEYLISQKEKWKHQTVPIVLSVNKSKEKLIGGFSDLEIYVKELNSNNE